jgi:hypothetical protein
MKFQDERNKFSEKLDRLMTAISEIEDDFNFKMLKDTNQASETGKKLANKVLTPLNKWRKSYNTLLAVLTRAEEYQSKGLTPEALSELTGVRSGLGDISAMDLLDEILTKVIPLKADILDFLAEISDTMTSISTVFQELKRPLETAMNQYSYALSAVPVASTVVDTLKQSEATVLADPVEFNANSSGISTLRELVEAAVAELKKYGEKLANAPLLKEQCKALLAQLPQVLASAQKIVKEATVVSASLPSVPEYVALVRQGKVVLKALESGQITDINRALEWQGDAHKTLDQIEAVLRGIDSSLRKLSQNRAKFRTLRKTMEEFGLSQDSELQTLEADARDILAREPVDVTTFEQLVTSFSARIQDLRRNFS